MPDEAELSEWARVLAFTVLPVFKAKHTSQPHPGGLTGFF